MTAPTLVRPEILAKLHHLEVAARIVVEGLQTGAHRSPHKGHSVDFADHRPYVAGDDLRHLDWKVLGRSDRLVLKRYEAETDLGCTVAVDGSGSMGYQGARSALSKYRYACLMAATIAHLVLEQQDRVGLDLFTDHAVQHVKPQRQGQMGRICRLLENHVTTAATDAVKSLEHLSAPTTHKGLIAVFSDFMVDLDELKHLADRLRHRGHDVALVWILDPDELDLDVATVSRFQGLENDGELVAEPRSLRLAYAEQVRKHRVALQSICRARRIALVECTTAEPPQVPLNRLLVGLNDDHR